MDDSVNATVDANTELALRNEVMGEFRGKVSHDNCANHAPEACANTDGSELERV